MKGIKIRKYDFNCDVCGRWAGSIEVSKKELITTSFMGKTTMPKGKKFLDSIIRDVERNDIKSVLDKLLGNNLAFYCPRCDKSYCKDHWKTRMYWEDGAWYDYTMGTCPKGHERMIDD